MANNEKSGSKAATIASKVLAGKTPTKSEAKTLAGSVLTQTSDKKKR